MPELAEVEFFRRKWEAGVGAAVTRVHLHGTKRLFRGTDTAAIAETLAGATLQGSEAHGKQMLFRFSRLAWLGVHLGMTGELRVEPAGHVPARHDHLVLFQRQRALVFSDPRQFGRVHFYQGPGEPPWWSDLPPSINSPGYTSKRLKDRLARHRSLPLKAALLDQETFPGIGNWMADEILWQARLNPRLRAGDLDEAKLQLLWRTTRLVARRSLETIAKKSDHSDFGDPPRGYLFHVRWRKGGRCPRCGSALKYETVGGRTTVSCPKCQARGSGRGGNKG